MKAILLIFTVVNEANVAFHLAQSILYFCHQSSRWTTYRNEILMEEITESQNLNPPVPLEVSVL